MIAAKTDTIIGDRVDQAAQHRPLGWQRTLAFAAFAALLLETIFTVPYRSASVGAHAGRLALIAGLLALGFAALLFVRRSSILARLRQFFFTRGQNRVQARVWFYGWLTFGLLTRLAWALRFPITLKSDGLAYFAEAQSLAEQHTYVGAHWPPGWPLFEAPFFMVFGAHLWVTVLIALLLFTVAFVLTYRLAVQLGGADAGRIACLLLALWPTSIALAGVNSKENLVEVLLLACIFFYVGWLKQDSLPALVVAGLCMGCCTLAQPGYILFPFVILVGELLNRRQLLRPVAHTAVFGVAMLVAILPYSFYNYVRYQHFVLISTNGGTVFYGANSEYANGSYEHEAETTLPKDELAASSEGYRRGIEWIRTHPLGFARVAILKQITYLGDDGIGPYESLKRDLNPNPKFYAATKLICNAYWFALSLLVFVGLSNLFAERPWTLWWSVLALPLLYQWVIESIFESGSRHHVAYTPLLIILCAFVLTPALGSLTRSPEVRDTVEAAS